MNVGLNLGYLVILVTSLAIVTQVYFVYNVQKYFHQFFVNPPTNETEYDFIVVGSGSSGSVVAARLAEVGHSVLLVEAGGPSHWMQGIPSFTPFFMTSPYDWKYKTKPDGETAKAFKDGSLNFPRGKSLGGSSMLNWMLYVRGHSEDYNEWRDLGNPGWGYQDVLRLFKKSERYHGSQLEDETYHGTEGPLGVMPTQHHFPLRDVLLEAYQELGYPIGDINGAAENVGFSTSNQLSVNNGWRLGTYKSFVEPLLGKPGIKLDVVSFAQATEILFDRKRAIGVKVERFGQTLKYLSKKELVVSGGAVGSPQLLMLSGIGPKKHLEELDIPVRRDLPVGQNLQDHLLVSMFVSSNRTNLGMSPYGTANVWNYLQFILFGSGPFTNNGISSHGFLHSPVNDDKRRRPDLQFFPCPFGFDIDFGIGLKEVFNIDDSSFLSRYEALFKNGVYTYLLLPTLLRPKSIGTIRLRSKDPSVDPIIDPKYLTHKDDLRVLVEGCRFAHILSQTKAFSKVGLEPMPLEHKHCGSFEAYSDDYWKCFVKHWSMTVYHPAGTCKMGPENDSTSVVNSRLNVIGLEGLRVADASIMPKVVGGNTHAPCVMIGEKAAEMIIEDWQNVEEPGKTKDSLKKDEL